MSSETDSVHVKFQAAAAFLSASMAWFQGFGGIGSILKSTRRVSVTPALSEVSSSVLNCTVYV